MSTTWLNLLHKYSYFNVYVKIRDYVSTKNIWSVFKDTPLNFTITYLILVDRFVSQIQ